MVDFILQLVSLFLIAAGLLFILIEFLVRFDRSFLFLGVALILFGFIPVSDIWVLPREKDPAQILLWARIQHILLTMLIPAVLWYLRSFLKSDPKRFLVVMIIIAAAIAPLFSSDAMLTIKDGRVTPGTLYHYVYWPFLFIAAGRTVWLIIARFKGSSGNERRILFYHLVGFALLGSFALIDTTMVSLRNTFFVAFPNSFILGVFAFGIMVFLIFSERFFMLVQDRQSTYEKLQVAYREMEEASTLRQIGESTAIINHEIKNYLTGISASAQMLGMSEKLSEEGNGEIRSIMKAISDLQKFSLDLLQLSRARIIKEKELLTIVPLIQLCIANHFSDRRNSIALVAMDQRFTVHGDWSKLEHVFVNLFNNAFEAEASAVTISFRATPTFLLITITDNGTGCTAEQMPNLFKAFYTTKKGRKGTGLGLSISRAIVESHGGHINAYPCNGLGKGCHGLMFTITLPNFTDAQEQGGSHPGSVVLVREGIDNFGTAVQPFTNVGLLPLVVQSAMEVESMKNGQQRTIVAVESAQRPLKSNGRSGRFRFVTIECEGGTVYVRDHASPERRDLFSEEYVVEKLLPVPSTEIQPDAPIAVPRREP
jgi:signal transduction histidine kinase